MTSEFASPPRTTHTDSPLRPGRRFAMLFSSTPRGARLARRLAGQWLDTSGLPYGGTAHHAVTLIVAELARTPSPTPRRRPRPEPRVTGMRECATRHTQPRLFTPPPGSDTDLCPECRDESDERPTAPTEPPQANGYDAFRPAREAERQRGRRRGPRT